MDFSGSLAGNVAVYLWYVLGSCVRYFAVAGGIYGVFYVWFRREWIACRIQKTFPGRDEVGHEIRWSPIESRTGVHAAGALPREFNTLFQRPLAAAVDDVRAYG